jgi:hypothetical protein
MYRHTQRSALALFVLCLGAVIPIGFLISGMLAPMEAGLRITLLAASLAMLVSAFVFSSLTIAIRDGQLSWWFGPGVVKKTVPLSSIISAEPTTTSFINGWGIHLTSRGWLYNVAGRDAVLVTQRDGKRFLLGTDEPESLAQAIRTGAGSR